MPERTREPLPPDGARLVVPGTDVVVPLPAMDPEAPEARKAEARATAADPGIRALLDEADRDFAAGRGIAAEDLRRELATEEACYDPKTDTLHVPLGGGSYARAVDLDSRRTVAYAADGSPFGVEIRCASQGVVLAGLPDPHRIAAEARRHSLPIVSTPSGVAAG